MNEQNFIKWLLEKYSINCDSDEIEYYCDNVDKEYIKKVSNVVEPMSYVTLKSQNNSDYYYCRFSVKNGTMCCQFGKSDTIFIESKMDTDNPYQYNLTKLRCRIKIIIFENNSVYYSCNTKKGDKLVPLSLKTIYNYLDNPYFADLKKQLFLFMSSRNPIYNDIEKNLGQQKLCLLPLNFNEIGAYYNLSDLFCKKYKIANELAYRWNKRNINLSYMIIKSYTYVKPECRNKLLQLTTFCFDNGFTSGGSYKKNVIKFLTEYISEQLIKYNGDIDDTTIFDYVSMCLEYKEKVNINFRSYKKLVEEHNKLSEENYMKKTPTVKIRKDTKFKELRKILPEEFEWIKTRKRLIQETVMQHHCVWSYASRINRDSCQIYSYVDKDTGKRYTLEFVIKRKKYACVQVRGIQNSSDDGKIYNLVNELLSKQKVNKS